MNAKCMATETWVAGVVTAGVFAVEVISFEVPWSRLSPRMEIVLFATVLLGPPAAILFSIIASMRAIGRKRPSADIAVSVVALSMAVAMLGFYLCY